MRQGGGQEGACIRVGGRRVHESGWAAEAMYVAVAAAETLSWRCD